MTDERAPHEPYDAPPIDLRDDGTLDTVLVCRGCGTEARYNYGQDEGDRTLDEFVEWAREDFAADHDCTTEEQNHD